MKFGKKIIIFIKILSLHIKNMANKRKNNI